MKLSVKIMPGVVILNRVCKSTLKWGVAMPWVGIKAMMIVAMLIHGFGHALMLFVVTGQKRAFAPEILLEGIPWRELMQSLRPTTGLLQFTERPPSISWPLPYSGQYRLVAAGGIVMNALSMVIALALYRWLLSTSMAGDWSEYLALSALSVFCFSSLLTMCSIPDIVCMIKGFSRYWACGPAFTVRYKLTDEEKKIAVVVSERTQQLVEILSREASTRGGQSGGYALIAQKFDGLSIIFDKVVKGKREDIVKVLCEKLHGLLRKAKKEGFKRPGDFEVVLLHLRYATGGSTNWHNAQPHWYEHYDAMMHHKVENNQLRSQSVEVFNLIAHNGDMDGVHLEFTFDGKRIRQLFRQSEARAVFQAMMPETTSQGDSDSRSVAEWVDFVYTRGLAFKSLRYAYFTAVLDFNRDIVTGKFNIDKLHHWAERVDYQILHVENHFDANVLPETAESIHALHDDIKDRIRQSLLTEIGESMDASTADDFVATFEEAFYRHDLTWVMRQASRDLVGEFALMVSSTLEPRMGVFSLTQAFSIGHNRSKGEIFGSAEPQGVTSSLHSGDVDDLAEQINLEDGQYATIDYQAQPGNDAILIYDRAQLGDDFSSHPTPALKALESSVHESDSAWFSVNNNPKIDRSTRQEIAGEEIKRDISEIPYTLSRIVESFKPSGENFQTMNHFTELLFDHLKKADSDAGTFDLVVFGVDFNQDLADEFSQALRSLLPGIKVKSENSGGVLKEIKRAHREGISKYGAKTIFLGVSNSAQTQSTLAAIRKAEQFVGPDRCFVLSQSLLNSMSQALGQGYHDQDPMLPNTFINLSHLSPDGTCGRRRSEAATIVIAATQAVLTEILLAVAQKAIEINQTAYYRSSEQRSELIDVRHDLQFPDIDAFREFQAAVYDVEIPNRVGFNVAGEYIDSPDSVIVENEAKARAENHIEYVRAYALFALYIFIATLFGIPVFYVISSPLHDIFGVSFIASVLDASLFLLALWLIHLAIRYHQGRPVLERIGARAELYIDRKYVARIVERYNATLFANAPAFLTPFFYWADTVQDALHRFGIRAHRGVVTIHRTPDERMGVEEANNAAEENMVFAQIGGIRFNFGQPQSRDKVRHNSRYMNRHEQDYKNRPYQTVLSDSLESLRSKYNHKLSSETMRLINRRLIDLSDGLVFEFVVGARRKEIINQSVWEVARLLPGATLIYRIFLKQGIDLHRIIGDADTANQAQIQSTKHPVSPIDIDIETMEPRPTVDACISQEQVDQGQSFAILVFFENYISVVLNGLFDEHRQQEILLKPGKYANKGKLVNAIHDDPIGKITGVLHHIDGQEYLVLEGESSRLHIEMPMSQLSAEQQHFLKLHLNIQTRSALSAAA